MIVKYVKCYLTLGREIVILPGMSRTPPEGTGAWNFRGIPRDLMRKVKMAAAHEGQTVKDFLINLAEAKIQEFERRGVLPKGK